MVVKHCYLAIRFLRHHKVAAYYETVMLGVSGRVHIVADRNEGGDNLG